MADLPRLAKLHFRRLNGMTDNKPDIEDALGLYGEILKVAPEDAATYADRGTTYAMIKKMNLALSDLHRAIELGYTDASAYCTIATIFLESGDYPQSLAISARR